MIIITELLIKPLKEKEKKRNKKEGGEKMNCPYCGGALEKGTLHSRGGEYFLPDGAKLPAWFTRESMEKVGAVGLAWNPALTQREWPEAYCCRPCRRLIVPFPEEE